MPGATGSTGDESAGGTWPTLDESLLLARRRCIVTPQRQAAIEALAGHEIDERYPALTGYERAMLVEVRADELVALVELTA